jgi:dihydroorotase
MSNKYSLLIKNAECYIDQKLILTDIAIKDNIISKISENISDPADQVLDAKGLSIFPGIIDTQVHFREPGDPDKETLESGSKAAVLGGVTSVFEMPNTSPPTDSPERFQEKLDRAKDRMHCNYAFYYGATENNSVSLDVTTNLEGCCGVKMFVGSSTGNLLVKDDKYIEQVIKNSPRVVSVHSEDEDMLNANKDKIIEGDVQSHYVWRSVECAMASTKKVAGFAKKHNKRVHVLHVSTKDEIEFLRDYKDIVSIETTPNHLSLFAPDCYKEQGTFVQMNPPVRGKEHMDGIWKGVLDGTVDVIGSDHAPHTKEQKLQTYPASPSGMPGVQTIFLLMLKHYFDGKIELSKVISLLSESPCKLFGIEKRGYIKEGFYADLTVVNMKKEFEITNDWIASNCKWTPFHGWKIKATPCGTIVNGNVSVWDKKLVEQKFGKPLRFVKS